MEFVKEHKDNIHGILHGFDRLIFRGYLSGFFHPKGMYYYMSRTQVKLTAYNSFMKKQHAQFRGHIRQLAQSIGVEIQYLNNSKESKEQRAKKELAKAPSRPGLVCILSALETSPS